MKAFDLTPHPKIYIAITNTKMLPIDALCELIDNAIDSFQVAELQGLSIEHPMVIINLPRVAELNRNQGLVRIRDNGPGMSAEKMELAIKAGFSGNNPYDSLGLFGMGFNISTGKFGQRTRIFSAQLGKSEGVEAVIDLEQLRLSESFEILPREMVVPDGFEHGTVIEVTGWWPPGNQNSDFVKKLVQYGIPTIRREVGIRYATILRENRVRIVINEEPCVPFEHCHWAHTRSVERRGIGTVPAVFRFDQLIGTQVRCLNCTALIPEGNNSCLACGMSSLRTVEERVTGWVGIQRYDDETEFGIDLIRNGRAIRIAEKAAFFEYVDEFKKTTKDYPIDQIYGRIVGEVHMNHVPVDFTKEDFQRSSSEWQKAISFLRGDTSLQPGKVPVGQTNESPIYKLYQAYRRVRKPGRTDMYMGYWDKESDEPKRISRDIEQEYIRRFEAKEPGYYDDAEWWKLVEQADNKPIEELVTCPNCKSQNLKEHDACAICNFVLRGKTCLKPECSATLPESAASCPDCGSSQIPEVQTPWTCKVCRRSNSPSAEICIDCGTSTGAPDPLSLAFLLENSNKVDDLSIPGCSVQLADSSFSSPIDVDVFATDGPLVPLPKGTPIPMVVFKDERIHVFIDQGHTLFRSFRIRPEQMVAGEVAVFIYDMNRRLTNQEYRIQHSISNLTWQILRARWATVLEDSPERVNRDVNSFFDGLKERLPELLGDSLGDFFDDLDEDQKKRVADRIIGQNIDLSRFSEMKATGRIARFLDARSVIAIFKRNPERFFDGRFWIDTLTPDGDIPLSLVEQVRRRTEEVYINCLEDLASFLDYLAPDPIIVHRARASLQFLQQKMN